MLASGRESKNPLHQSRPQIIEDNGVNPYPHEFDRSCSLFDVYIDFDYVGKDGTDVALKLCGRVARIRAIGKSRYVLLQDKDTELQFFLGATILSPEEIEKFDKCVQQGDWVGFTTNWLYRTSVGELTARVTHWAVLSPCLAALLESDTNETQQELQRFLKLARNLASRKSFVNHSNAIRFLRRFLEDQYGFLEVKTPLLRSLPSQDEGTALEITLNGSGTKAFLRGSSKPYLKQLIVSGFDAVYEIGDCFGTQPADWSHHGETQVLECCLAPADLNDVMSLIERLFTELMSEQNRTLKLTWESYQQLKWRAERRSDLGADYRRRVTDYSEPIVIDFTLPWQRQSVFGLVQEVTGVDFLSLKSVDEAIVVSQSVGIDIGMNHSYATVGAVALHILDELVIPNLTQPTFLVDFPFEEAPSGKRHRYDPRLAESFVLIVNGMRFAEGHTEPNDPRDLAHLRMLEGQTDETIVPADDLYADALNYGLPPTGSLRINLDRLMMLLMSTDDIRDTRFPSAFS